MIEEEMNAIIESSEVLCRQMKLLTSIDGIGRIVAMNMIITILKIIVIQH